MTYLRKSWFQYEAISTRESNRLVKQYSEKGYHVEKTLNTDKKLWDVSVKLEESRNNKPTPRCMINKVWHFPLYKNPTLV